MKITKAVIPVAGLGTRFLPAAKTVPKEMLPNVDTSYEVEDTLEKAGRTELLKPVHEIVKRLKVVSIRQHVALGLGHAVLCAEPAIGRDPFAVLLGDEILIAAPGRPSGIAQLARIYEETKQSTVAVMEVADRDVSKYGIVKVSEKGPNLWSVLDVVEKPEIGQAPSRLALPGRYVFAGGIFDDLRQTRPVDRRHDSPGTP